ncbi:MFS transporter [Pantanalinema rosaneae CENA516]|uniref:MFS transporter n=1 Tax=Pantanalinema rosaneae TaxID=1620701 RepID=UPI003D6FD657
MSVFSTLQPEPKRHLMVLFGVGLLFWSSMATLLPTLSLYLETIGATKHQIGIVMGGFAIGLLIFRPQLGRMADHRGRKLVLVIGVLAATIAPLGYLMTDSIPLLFGVRIFHGISIAAFATAYSALVVDLTPPQHRGEIIGIMTLVNPIGVAIGPALGGFLQEYAGNVPLFLAASGLGVTALMGTSQIQAPPLSELPSDPNEVEPAIAALPFWRLLSSPPFRIPTLLLLLVGLAFGTLSTFVPLFIKESQVPLNVGLFYTAAALSSFIVRMPTGKASDRYGRGRFITVGLGFYALAMLLLWFANSAPAFLIAGFAEGAGAGIFLPTMITLIADRSPSHDRGRIFGLCMAGFDLGMAIAGPSLGFVADAIGYRSLFGIASGLVFVAIGVFLTLSSKTLSHSLRFALTNGHDVYASSGLCTPCPPRFKT